MNGQREFTTTELRSIIAVMGICLIGASVFYLRNAWPLLGLLPVALLVAVIEPRKQETNEAVDERILELIRMAMKKPD